MIANAGELSGGQATIVFKTVGPYHLHVSPIGEISTTGEWLVDRHRVKKCAHVQVYVLPEGADTATVYFGRFHGVTDAPINSARAEIAFVLEGIATSTAKWDAYSNSRHLTRRSFRYLP